MFLKRCLVLEDLATEWIGARGGTEFKVLGEKMFFREGIDALGGRTMKAKLKLNHWCKLRHWFHDAWCKFNCWFRQGVHGANDWEGRN